MVERAARAPSAWSHHVAGGETRMVRSQVGDDLGGFFRLDDVEMVETNSRRVLHLRSPNLCLQPVGRPYLQQFPGEEVQTALTWGNFQGWPCHVHLSSKCQVLCTPELVDLDLHRADIRSIARTHARSGSSICHSCKCQVIR